jgi:hypothetical protein
MKPPVFIVGPHRSGSTVWHNLIAMCPDILRLTDPRFLGRQGQLDFSYFLRSQVRGLPTEDDVRTMVDLCFSRKHFSGLEGALWRFEGITVVDDPRFREAVVDGVCRSDRSLAAIARVIISEITRFSGYERACVKFPVDVTRMPVLLDWFPGCKIVHITRDPRGIAASKSNDPSGTAVRVAEHPRLAWVIRRSALMMVIKQYRAAARLHLELQRLPNYRLFRYEDLLASPEAVVRNLCEFIEVPFDSSFVHLERGRHEHQPSSLTGRRQKALDPAAAVRWRSALSGFDRAMISMLTKKSMRQFGYDPDTHPVMQLAEPRTPLAQVRS